MKTPEQEAEFSLRNFLLYKWPVLHSLRCPLFSQAILKAPRPEGGEQGGEGTSAAPELSAFVPPEAPGGGYPSSSSRVAEFFWCFLLLSAPPKTHEI